MDSIEYNNKERTKQLGSVPSSEMTKRDLIAMEAMSSLIISMNISTDKSLTEVAELAVKMADSLISKLN